MINIIAQIVGLVAVAIFFLSYQQKKRNNIILLNVISRCLYILQYLLLGAFSGALLDIMGAIASAIAGKKDIPAIKKHLKAVIIALDFSIIVAGGILAFYSKNWLDIFPIFGVLLHTGAFWMSDEKMIRRISLIGSPFWLVYNFLSHAYGSVVGDILSMCSIIIAMIRYKNVDMKTKNV